MSQPKPVAKSLRAIAVLIASVLIIAPFVGLLWVPLYSKAAPKAGGFPFFYWYQLAWVPAVAVLSVLAWLLVGRSRRGGGGAGVAASGGAGSGGAGAGGTRTEPASGGYGQPPAGGWYGEPPGAPPPTASGPQAGGNSGTETTS